MLTDEMIENNKQEFLSLVKSISRENSNLDALCNWLECSDFFVAPASVKYHAAYKGGLCAHSLNVYRNLVNLIYDWGMQDTMDADTPKILGLLHDLSKINTYKLDIRNKKIYSETGSKRDDMGRFDWKSVPEYAHRDDTDKFIYANHESTSEYYIRQFIPLSYVESIAIIHHHGNMSWDSMQDNIGSVWNAYPISLLLYQADCQAAFINENTYGNNFSYVQDRTKLVPNKEESEEVENESTN